MKVLHTSDWHIGKRLQGKDRLDEQREVLAEIADICLREKVELVLVAGDIFDTYLPSAEAEDIFYDAVKALAADGRCVLLISGNHDDNIRLTAATALSEEQGIYIYGNIAHVPRLCIGREINAVEAGPNHIVFKNASGEEVFVNVLPYPNEARLREEKHPEESFSDKMKRWIDAGERMNSRKLPEIFLSHIFVAGGQVSEGEREIDLGGARAVPLSLLPHADYTALGHLHRRQHFKNNVWYSGSILQYAFDEAGAQKSVVTFDINKDGVKNIQEIPLTKGKQLVRLSADGVENAMALLANYTDCYAELSLYLREPLLASQVRALKEADPGLLSILPRVQAEGQPQELLSRKEMSSSELFREYYKSIYAEEPSKELTELFLSFTEENADEA